MDYSLLVIIETNPEWASSQQRKRKYNKLSAFNSILQKTSGVDIDTSTYIIEIE